MGVGSKAGACRSRDQLAPLPAATTHPPTQRMGPAIAVAPSVPLSAAAQPVTAREGGISGASQAAAGATAERLGSAACTSRCSAACAGNLFCYSSGRFLLGWDVLENASSVPCLPACNAVASRAFHCAKFMLSAHFMTHPQSPPLQPTPAGCSAHAAPGPSCADLPQPPRQPLWCLRCTAGHKLAACAARRGDMHPRGCAAAEQPCRQHGCPGVPC